ncbi:hypothetical protein [Phreatobacter stygius]|uniref:Uncharacterized protein n=1 Tax=Phreatobacter stygius TaxID=1940610 RepID=A0A4D7B3B2_9HYPH|nr:hypothetical protein [Phreatobacter stygius]QCI68004.1 hypothetical protein E8M01_29520 [Phreatobacter stygius]
MPKRLRPFQVVAPPAKRQHGPATAWSCLRYVAEIAPSMPGQTIALANQRDQALIWKAAAVHPMQALENEYQGIVHDAVRGIVDPDQRKEVESRAMGEFFLFDAGPPRLLGVPRGGEYRGERFPIMEDRLRHARKALRPLAESIQAQADPEDVRRSLLLVLREFDVVLGSFFTIPGSGRWGAPILDTAIREFAGLDRRIRRAANWQQFEAAWKQLDTGSAALEETFEKSVSAVQMFYAIEGFYLFRLLVRYRIESSEIIRSGDATAASKQLTKLIANGHPWLSTWLRDKLLELNALMQIVDPSGNTLFFLKGGRAIKYLEGQPQTGENDWDTQIVINPNLPAAQWYQLFQDIQNAVLLALQGFKRELYVLMQHEATTFQDELDTVALPAPVVVDPGPQPLDPDTPVADDEQIAERYRMNCKAELIDVGLPRNDTVEAMEQWAQLNGKLLIAADGMPYPGYLYYINEYLMLVREVFTGLSPSMGKAPARIERLYTILTLPDAGLEAAIQEERHHIPADLLAQSLAAIDQVHDLAVKRALICILSQFCRAYALDLDPNLAACFDGLFAGNLGNAAELAQYPADLNDAIRGYAQWRPAYRLLSDAVGYAQWISKAMSAHFEARGKFMEEQQALIGKFIQSIYAASVFSPGEELEAQIAVTGSLAAFLHADYTKFPRPGELQPVDVASLRIYAYNPEANPAIVMQLVAPLVTEYLDEYPGTFVEVAPMDPAGPLRLFWPSEVEIKPFKYAPLVITIGVARPGIWPLLAYIWDHPTLGLRDLIMEYRGRSAAVEEFGARARLKETTAALTEILLRAENPEPPPAPFGRHLMISSAAMAIGPKADYPASYYQDGTAYKITMTGNREALRQALTLPRSDQDRTLDLLVLNQDHGGIVGGAGQFGQWSAADLQTYLVEPMRRSGLRARILVLDFCVSTALLPTFAALCAEDGVLYSNVYSITEVIMTRDLWGRIKDDLAARDRNAIRAEINDEMTVITRGVTGLSHLPEVQHSTQEEIAGYLVRNPGDLDAVSAFFTFWEIGQIFYTAYGNSQTIWGQLRALIFSTLPGNIGPAERAILGYVPAQFANFNRDQVQAMVTARAVQILTAPQYQIERPPPANATFQQLWLHFNPYRCNVLALFTGLARCPTPFTVYDSGDQSLTLDTDLSAAPVPAPVAARINVVHHMSSQDVDEVLDILQSQAGQAVVQQLDPQVNYLQQ